MKTATIGSPLSGTIWMTGLGATAVPKPALSSRPVDKASTLVSVIVPPAGAKSPRHAANVVVEDVTLASSAASAQRSRVGGPGAAGAARCIAKVVPAASSLLVRARREDWSANIGLTQ